MIKLVPIVVVNRTTIIFLLKYVVKKPRITKMIIASKLKLKRYLAAVKMAKRKKGIKRICYVKGRRRMRC